MDGLIRGVSLNPLKIITGDQGSIMHALKDTDVSFAGFGEAYFSTVQKDFIKGWKNHSLMTLNIIVPVGGIRFVIYDDREQSETYGKFNEFSLGSALEYARLTVAPNLWMAFQGLENGVNLLLNIASIKHDPTEAKSLPIDNDHIPKYKWQ